MRGATLQKKKSLLLDRIYDLNETKIYTDLDIATFICFWVTANTPTVQPWTPLHQAFASSLMVAYAIQATCKARIARITLRTRLRFRYGLAVVLWGTILATFLSFATLQICGPRVRPMAQCAMAAAVHLATAACVALMAVLASDLSNESVEFNAHSSPMGDKPLL